MKYLPLYESPPKTPVETTPGRPIDSECTRCELHANARSRCVPDEFIAGVGDETLMLVGESPGRDEDRHGRPFVGKSGAFLRMLLKKHWRGNVVLSNGIRCLPPANREDGAKKFKPREIAACRPFLAQTLVEVQPTRVITLGAWASQSVLGRRVPPMSARRGYAYMYGLEHEDPTPVFLLLHPAAALRNRFIRQWFEEDLEWAIKCKPPPEPPTGAQVGVLRTEADVYEALEIVEEQPWTTFDIETAGTPHELDFRVLIISIGLAHPVEGISAFACYDLNGAAGLVLRREYLANEEHVKFGQSVAYDDIGCEVGLKTRVRGIQGDVRLLRKLLASHADADLETIAELIGMGDLKDESKTLIKAAVAPLKKALDTEKRVATAERDGRAYKPKPATLAQLEDFRKLERTDPGLAKMVRDYKSEPMRFGFAFLPPDVLARRNAKDAVATARAKSYLEHELEREPDLQAVRHDVVDHVFRGTTRMQRWGIPVRVESIMAFDAYLEAAFEPLKKWAEAEKIDPNSFPKLTHYLYAHLKLPIVKRTKTGRPSTDKEALEILESRSPEVRKIVEYRHIVHTRSTYGVGLIRFIRPDGRIHPSILPDGTETGRPSCTKPNLYNIPRASDSPEGKLARDCYVAEDGFVFVELDQSQVELRSAAILSGDENMRAIYAEGANVDFHMRTAQMIAEVAWGIRKEDITPAHRTSAKTIVFAVLYGAGDDKVASQVRADLFKRGIQSDFSADDAARVKRAILGNFPRLKKWIRQCVEDAKRTGYMQSWWNGRPGRRRVLYQIADHDEIKQGHAERASWNGPCQALGAEFVNASIGRCTDWIEDNGLEKDVQLCLAIYDSLLFHVKKPMVDEVIKVASRIMTQWNTDGVPLKVDVKIGPSFGSMVEQKAS